MKTWILKSDLSRSPQAAFRMYACGYKKQKYDSDVNFINRPRHYFLARKLKSQLKNLSRFLTTENLANMDMDLI